MLDSSFSGVLGLEYGEFRGRTSPPITNLDGSLQLHPDGSLPALPEYLVWFQWPPNRRFFSDPLWYDTAGRDQLEQRGLYSLPKVEQAAAYLQLLTDFPDRGLELVFRASVTGNEDGLRALLGDGVSPVAGEDQDLTLVPLHAACFNGNLECAKMLKEKGVGVNSQDDLGGTPLMRAARGGHADIVKWLLEYGANPRTMQATFPDGDECGYTSLEFAAESGEIEAAVLMMECPGSSVIVTATTIRAAAASGSDAMMRLTLERGGHPVDLDGDDSGSDWKENRLNLAQRKAVVDAILPASLSGSLPLLRLLLEYDTPTRAATPRS